MSWAASNNPSNFGVYIQQKATTYTSTPVLFTVAAGSYATPGSFGSGAPQLENANEVQGPSSVYIIKTEDSLVDIDVKIVINLEGDAPFTGQGTEELRVDVRSGSIPQPIIRQAQGKALPPYDINAYFPLFQEVEFLQLNDQPLTPAFPPSSSGLGQLMARFLNGGQLALIVVNYNIANNGANHTRPLRASDLNAYFPLINDQTAIVISIKGRYIRHH